MLTRRQKIKYLWDSILASGQDARCPFCQSNDHREIDRKYGVTRLMECKNCHLYYRFPVDRPSTNAKFYQTEYKEMDRMATDMPDEEALRRDMLSGFSNTIKHGERFMNLFRRLFPDKKSLRIIDYGSSWGYMTYQFKKAGHEVQGYEISRSRAAFGVQKLDVEIFTSEADLRGGNDIFFSSHVIEHHPDIPAMIALAKKLLAPGGYFMAVSPNGSQPFRQLHPEAFHQAWGKVHPNYLNGEFYQYVFRHGSYYIGSNPFGKENIRPLGPFEQVVGDLSGEELLVIAQPE